LLNNVDVAFKIAEQQASVEKWRKVGDVALARGSFGLAQTCYEKSSDFNSLLLFYSSYGDMEGLTNLFTRAEAAGNYNIAFEAAFMISDVDKCLDVLLKAKRMGEAAHFAKSYAPSRLAEVTRLWSEFLSEQGLPYQPEGAESSSERLELERKLRALYKEPRPPAD
jgi:coatomer subunit beta'